MRYTDLYNERIEGVVAVSANRTRIPYHHCQEKRRHLKLLETEGGASFPVLFIAPPIRGYTAHQAEHMS